MDPELVAKHLAKLDQLSWHLDMLFITCMATLGLVILLFIRGPRL